MLIQAPTGTATAGPTASRPGRSTCRRDPGAYGRSRRWATPAGEARSRLLCGTARLEIGVLPIRRLRRVSRGLYWAPEPDRSGQRSLALRTPTLSTPSLRLARCWPAWPHRLARAGPAPVPTTTAERARAGHQGSDPSSQRGRRGPRLRQCESVRQGRARQARLRALIPGSRRPIRAR